MTDLVVHRDFLTADEDQAVRALIDQYWPRAESSARHVVRFGPFRPCGDGILVAEIPPVLRALQERLSAAHLMDGWPESVSLNLYPPRATILPHVDNYLQCGPVVGVVGLLAPNDLLFRRLTSAGGVDHSATATVHTERLPAGALLLLQGDKRYHWTHETQPIDECRASLVFRTRRDGDVKHCPVMGEDRQRSR